MEPTKAESAKLRRSIFPKMTWITAGIAPSAMQVITIHGADQRPFTVVVILLSCMTAGAAYACHCILFALEIKVGLLLVAGLRADGRELREIEAGLFGVAVAGVAVGESKEQLAAGMSAETV